MRDTNKRKKKQKEEMFMCLLYVAVLGSQIIIKRTRVCERVAKVAKETKKKSQQNSRPTSE